MCRSVGYGERLCSLAAAWRMSELSCRTTAPRTARLDALAQPDANLLTTDHAAQVMRLSDSPIAADWWTRHSAQYSHPGVEHSAPGCNRAQCRHSACGTNPESKNMTPWAQVLDMVTDRLSTAGLLAVLGMLYPRSYMVFLTIMFLDIFSHWFQMYSTFISGSETHKVGPRAVLWGSLNYQVAGRAHRRRLGLRLTAGEQCRMVPHGVPDRQDVSNGMGGVSIQQRMLARRPPDTDENCLPLRRTSTARAGWCACTTSTGCSWAPAASRARSCTCRCAP